MIAYMKQNKENCHFASLEFLNLTKFDLLKKTMHVYINLQNSFYKRISFGSTKFHLILYSCSSSKYKH